MTNVLILIGAINNLSNERLLLSNVIVTASIEVVPNNTLIAIKPGSNPSIPISPCERISCISVQESGNIIPNLYLAVSNITKLLLYFCNKFDKENSNPDNV